MFHGTIHQADLVQFKASLHGELISQGDENYESARKVWNGAIDRRPALIVRCADAPDVITAVQFARSQNLTVAVRGGGHDVAGYGVCDDGLVIDLSQMKDIQVDPEQHTARAEPGLTSGELLNELQQFGLAIPTGVFSTVGISGLTLGGGIGWLTSKYGLTIDNLLSVEIVTADGRLLTANSSEHLDLFWAVRGGGGNFGVVTAFTFRLHSLAQVLAGNVIYPLPRAHEVLRFYREYTRNSPDELTVNAVLATAPDGHPVIILTAWYSGDLAEGERVLAPLRTFGPPIIDLIRPMTVLEATQLSDAFSPPGQHICYRAESVKDLSDELFDTVIRYAPASPSTRAVIYHLHGAAMRIDQGATAFALRKEHYVLEMIDQWSEGDAQPHISWSRQFQSAIEPFASKGVYVNFLEDEDDERIRASYGVNYGRLARIKSKYDPTNFFHVNHNIKPIM